MAKETKNNVHKSGRSPWMDIQPYNPVKDIWNPNRGPSKKEQAPKKGKK